MAMWPASGTDARGCGEGAHSSDRAASAGRAYNAQLRLLGCFWWHLRCAAGAIGSTCGAPPWTPGPRCPSIGLRGAPRAGGGLQRWGFRRPSPPSAGKRWHRDERPIDPMTGWSCAGQRLPQRACRPTTASAKPSRAPPLSLGRTVGPAGGTVLVLIDSPGGSVTASGGIRPCCAPGLRLGHGRCWR